MDTGCRCCEPSSGEADRGDSGDVAGELLRGEERENAAGGRGLDGGAPGAGRVAAADSERLAEASVGGLRGACGAGDDEE